MEGVRAYYAAVVEAIRAKDARLPALAALSSPRQRNLNVQVLGEELGAEVPGPIPLEPLAVQVKDKSTRVVTFCILGDGWTRNPKTHKPRKPKDIVGLDAYMVHKGKNWIMDDAIIKSPSTCKGVKLP